MARGVAASRRLTAMGAVVVLTNSEDVTVDHLEARARLRGVAWHRIDTDRVDGLSLTLSDQGPAALTTAAGSVTPSEVTGVWYRRPLPVEIRGDASEGERQHAGNEWAASVEAWLAAIPTERWVNAPASNVKAGRKVEQLWQARQFGLAVPETLLTTEPGEARRFFDQHGGRLIVKPVSWGTVVQDDGEEGAIYTSRLSSDDRSALDLVRRCPTLLQREVDRAYDVRLTWIDGNAIAVRLDRPDGHVDVRYGNMDAVRYTPVDVPPQVATRLAGLLQSYSLRFGAVDFLVDHDGEWVFLEVNPNGQWAWLEEVDCGVDISGPLLDALTAS